MPLVNTQHLLQHAYQHGYAVCAFDVVGLESLQAVMAGAEATSAPVIVSVAESHDQQFNPELLLPAVVAAARLSLVPVAIHLDRGRTLQSAIDAVRLGCNGVMVDYSHLGLTQNIASTREVVAMAQSTGIATEGALGRPANVDGQGPKVTEPDEAKRYCDETDVDALMVSIGTIVGGTAGAVKPDLDRLAQINRAVGRPLVMDDATARTDGEFQSLIDCGVAKINCSTTLDTAVVQAVQGGGATRFSDIQQVMRSVIQRQVERCCTIWGGAGRAEAALVACMLWREVEHLIIFNTAGLDEAESVAMIEQGRATLAAIPGVRRVVTGTAVKEGVGYRYSWLVRFASERVIETYRDHPAHLAYADHHFRPVAGERVSIDYRIW